MFKTIFARLVLLIGLSISGAFAQPTHINKFDDFSKIGLDIKGSKLPKGFSHYGKGKVIKRIGTDQIRPGDILIQFLIFKDPLVDDDKKPRILAEATWGGINHLLHMAVAVPNHEDGKGLSIIHSDPGTINFQLNKKQKDIFSQPLHGNFPVAGWHVLRLRLEGKTDKERAEKRKRLTKFIESMIKIFNYGYTYDKFQQNKLLDQEKWVKVCHEKFGKVSCIGEEDGKKCSSFKGAPTKDKLLINCTAFPALGLALAGVKVPCGTTKGELFRNMFQRVLPRLIKRFDQIPAEKIEAEIVEGVAAELNKTAAEVRWGANIYKASAQTPKWLQKGAKSLLPKKAQEFLDSLDKPAAILPQNFMAEVYKPDGNYAYVGSLLSNDLGIGEDEYVAVKQVHHNEDLKDLMNKYWFPKLAKEKETKSGGLFFIP